MKRLLLASAALAGAVLLSGCETFNGLFGDGPAGYVNALDAGYTGWCIANPHDAGCTVTDRKKEQHAKQLALDGIAAYEAGTMTQADMQKLITDLENLIADFKRGKHGGW